MSARASNRRADELRPVRITRHYTRHPEGSVLIECGETRVMCTVSVEQDVPPFLRGRGQGWITAEYGMLPRATNTRSRREAAEGRQSGRTQEIQRLIGRSLRAIVDLKALGERTLRIDCDSSTRLPTSSPRCRWAWSTACRRSISIMQRTRPATRT